MAPRWVAQTLQQVCVQRVETGTEAGESRERNKASALGSMKAMRIFQNEDFSKKRVNAAENASRAVRRAIGERQLGVS